MTCSNCGDETNGKDCYCKGCTQIKKRIYARLKANKADEAMFKLRAKNGRKNNDI